MIKLYLQFRLKSLLRLCKEVGIFACTILLFIIFILIGITTNAPRYYTVLLFGAMVLSWHFSRSDTIFLNTLFGKKYIYIYHVEYFILSVPFIFILLSKSSWIGIIAVLLLSTIVPFLVRKTFSFPLPTFPFLIEGSYKYQRLGRMLLPFYIIILVISSIAVYVHNINLVFITTLITTATIGMSLCIQVNPQYIFNYKSSIFFLKLKCKHAFVNAGVMLAPMILYLWLVNVSWGQLYLCILSYIVISLFFIQLEFLRFIFGNNDLTIFIAFSILLCLLTVSIMLPIFSLLSLLLTILFSYKVLLFLKKYIS
ncbi:hypothetical protein EJ73_00720 [Hoylesella shahii DSM 15611 = JCM 12083]|jgi:membrane protein|uniref:Uncharacterized protein n=1 Tax=Hoylesella shahii DSM 15611 = JCM 12083 TaxID=1122991 RepID=A0A318IFD9_9BACT|nr:hypothetical protein EJ73_00720 [Hoylesella shahii DSM 15611 = JCM 12083]